MARGFRPLQAHEDGMTFLPIDRSRAAEKVFGPTDLRNTKGIGGARIGRTPVFVPEDGMPRLTPEGVAGACDAVVSGQGSYAGLLYLSRAQVEDLPAMFAASQSPEIKVRWERLWVLSPLMARLARHDEGREAILSAFRDDLAGVHLLSKFAEQNNPSVKRLFARLHDPLLVFLLARLHQYREDPRRAALLSAIIGTLETKEEVLRQALPEDVAGPEADALLSLLYIRYGAGQSTKLSSAVLRDRLQQWRR